MRRRIYLLCPMMFAAACASSGTSASSAGPSRVETMTAPETRSSPTLITRAQIDQSNALNALQVIERIRPNFLAMRSGGSAGSNDPGIIVYVNGSKMGGVNRTDKTLLEQLPAQELLEIRYLSAQEATQAYGTGHVHGAILIRTK